MWHLLIGLSFGEEAGVTSMNPKCKRYQNSPFKSVSSPICFGCWCHKWHVILIKNGGFVGLETSLSRVNGNRLLGLSGDVLWDTGLGGVSATIGPRIGVLMLAMDGGISVRNDFTSPVDTGAQLRWLVDWDLEQCIIVRGFGRTQMNCRLCIRLGLG